MITVLFAKIVKTNVRENMICLLTTDGQHTLIAVDYTCSWQWDENSNEFVEKADTEKLFM